MHIFLTLAVFALTLALIIFRPYNLNEAWATSIGGVLMLLFQLETPLQAWQSVAQGSSVLLFLLALLIFSDLLKASGFFEWASIHAVCATKGDGRALYRNVFILGSVTTAFLSLDTTAVILTPIVLSFVGRLKLQARPFLLACAFVANTGSLLLPVSNLTNLLFVNDFGWGFSAFTLRMLFPQVVALAVNYWLFRYLFSRELPEKFEWASLPQPNSVLPDVPYFRVGVLTLTLVLIGYCIGSLVHVESYFVALAGCVVLFIYGCQCKQVDWKIVRDISWSVFPFVIGLFVVVRGVENLGLAAWMAKGLDYAGHSTFAQILATSFGAGIGSNLINNIPMALLSISSLQHDVLPAARYGALLGCNLGPNLTVAGSLATMLVITSARRQGQDISARDFFLTGLRVTPILLLVSAVALLLSFLIVA